jgi:hypothetical protein
MADGLVVTVDEAAVVEALLALGDFAQPYINEASRESAQSVEREVVARLRRQLVNPTGQTEAGVVSRPAYGGNGYVVIASRDWMPNLPLWIEKGTKKGRPGSSAQPARPFFYVSAALEEGAHFRRLEDALQDAIDARGLGE